MKLDLKLQQLKLNTVKFNNKFSVQVDWQSRSHLHHPTSLWLGQRLAKFRMFPLQFPLRPLLPSFIRTQTQTWRGRVIGWLSDHIDHHLGFCYPLNKTYDSITLQKIQEFFEQVLLPPSYLTERTSFKPQLDVEFLLNKT